MMYRIVFEPEAAADMQKIKASEGRETGTVEMVDTLFEVLRQDPFRDKPSYEKLSGKLDNYYARRVSLKKRMIYQVYMEPVRLGDAKYQGTVKLIRLLS